MSFKQFIKSYRKPLKITFIMLSVIATYALILGLLTPYLLKKNLPAMVSDNSSYSMQVEEIRINPFYLSLEVKELTIFDKNSEDFAGFSRLFVNFQLSSLFRWMWTFEEFTLEAPRLHYQLYQDSSTNFDELIGAKITAQSSDGAQATIAGNSNSAVNAEGDIAGKSAAKSESSEAANTVPKILVTRLNIDQLELRFTDHSKKEPFSAHIGPLNIELDKFTTQRELNSPYKLKATSVSGIIGTSLEWQGHVTILPLRSSGQFKIDGISLPTLYQYFKDDFPPGVRSGTLNLSAEYAIDLSQENMKLNVSKANMLFTDLFIKRKGVDVNDVQLNHLAINGLNYSLSENSVKVDEIILKDSVINVIRSKSGALNLLQMLPPSAEEESSETPQPKLKLAIDKISLVNNQLKLTDKTTEVATQVNLTAINMNLAKFSLQPKAVFPLNFSAIVEQSGNISAKGDLSLYPITANLKVNAQSVPVLSVEPYMHQWVISEIIAGNFDASMNIVYAAAIAKQASTSASPETIHITGDMALNNWRTRVTDNDEDYVRINKISVTGIDVKQPQNTVDIERVTIDKLWLNAQRNKQGVMNVATIRKERMEQRQEAVDEGKPAVVNLKHFQVNSSSVLYTDYSVSPRYKMRIDPLQITITGLSSDVNSRANIDLQGKINKFAPLKLKGSVNLLSETLYSNFNLLLNDVQMSDFTPYSGTYVGREIDKGKLNLNINYLIEDQALNATNTVFIDRFHLGDDVQSDVATSLPIGLAVSLLKDSKGEIHIDMPISGNLNDPDFSYGKLVWQTLGNLIIKAVSSPFSLLAGLVGSDEDLGSIEFIAGNPTPDQAMITRLNLLKKALLQRPELQLEVSGCYHEQDSEALRQEIFKQRINPNAQALSNEQRLPLLVSAYSESFGHAYDFSEAPIMDADVLISWKVDQLESVLLNNIIIDNNMLINLAQERSRNIQQVLLSDNKLAANRLIIGKVLALESSSDISCPLAPAG
ncbi:DUF748 domain-containing protein [Colwellia piezophila]|uniref:DUF748 domain-containing protein n=1 Tax=Colwellia piezophila TaxID=211668 RepID=UPI0003757218|nr:DUF748 domain-containing protein [Colwellia piezophila]